MISCVESNNTYIYKFAITPNFISIIRNHPVEDNEGPCSIALTHPMNYSTQAQQFRHQKLSAPFMLGRSNCLL